MNAAGKLATYGAGLGVALVAAFGVGAVAGPLDVTAQGDDHSGGVGEQTGHTAGGGHAGGGHADGGSNEDGRDVGPAEPSLSGLAATAGGLSLVLQEPVVAAGTTTVRFRVVQDDGTVVTAFEETHEERMHLIAVRRDTSGFQHVHPVMAADGVWRSDLDLTPGQWRLFADFDATDAEPLTLGTDLAVSGDYQPKAVGEQRLVATLDDGYEVRLTGEMAPGAETQLRVQVHRDGEPVTDLEPYLGAYGHLVALRATDLAYLHVHPEGHPGDGTSEPGPAVPFMVQAPSADTYRVFFDFRHDGQVRTADFVVTTGDGTTAPSAPASTDDLHSDDHAH